MIDSDKVENSPKHSANDDAPKERGFVDRFVSTFNPGYAVAGGAALWTSVLSIDRNFDDLLKRNGRLDPINKAAASAFHEVYPSWTKNVRDKQALATGSELVDGVHWKEYFTESELAKRGEAIAGELKRPGRIAAWRDEVINTRLSADMITNRWAKFQRLTKYQQNQIAATFVTIAAIGLGAVYTFAHQKHLSEELQHERMLNQQQQQQR